MDIITQQSAISGEKNAARLARRAAFREAAEMAEAEANELFAKGSEYTYTTNTKAHTLAGFAKTLRAKAEET